jgi:hypothetical protein
MTIQEPVTFEDCNDNTAIDFPAIWQIAKPTGEISSMTDEVVYETAQVQSTQTTSIHVFQQ